MTGGPGSAATASARPLTREHAALAGTHDFVFVDQRGTGESNPLQCSPPTDPGLPTMFSAASAAACRNVLEGSADLLAYTTADAVEDLEAIRQALDYARINLHGSSYGTRPAWAYAARFPQHARTLVLHGPAPPGFLIPLPFAQGLEVALDGVVTDCLEDRPCARRTPRLRTDVEAAFERLRSAPARVTLDEQIDTTSSRGELSEAVRYLLLFSERCPPPAAASHTSGCRRLHSDCACLGQLSPRAGANPDDGNVPVGHVRGRHSVPAGVRDRRYVPEHEAWRLPCAAADGRLQRVAAGHIAPRRPRPAAGAGIIQVGASDPATPLESARRAAAFLPNSRMVVVPHGAHAFGGLGIEDCLAGLTTAFIVAGTTPAVDDSCVAQARRPPFMLQ